MKRLVIWMVFAVMLISLSSSFAEQNAPQRILLAEGKSSQTEAYLFDSGKEGNTLFFLAGTHGNEEGGYLAAEYLLDNLEVLSGKVYLLPRANIQAIEAYTRISPDGTNLNRVFPGNHEGNDSEIVAAEIFLLIQQSEPNAFVDMHEGFNFYGVEGSIGNSLIIGSANRDFTIAMDVLNAVNENNAGRRDFTFDANAPEGSLNWAVSTLLGIDAYTIETPQVYELSIRIEQQLLFVSAFLDAYGVDVRW